MISFLTRSTSNCFNNGKDINNSRMSYMNKHAITYKKKLNIHYCISIRTKMHLICHYQTLNSFLNMCSVYIFYYWKIYLL